MAGFATGFFGGLADDIQERDRYVRERVAKQQDYLRTVGLQRQTKIAEEREALKTASSFLRERGMDEDKIIRIMESSPDRIKMLAAEAEKQNYSGSKLNSVIELNENYAPELSLEETIARVTPAFANLPQDASKPEVERRGLAALLGLDPEVALQDQVYNYNFPGMGTGAQIEASLTAPLSRGFGAPVELNLESLEPVSDRDTLTQRLEIADNVIAPVLRSKLSGMTPDERASNEGKLLESIVETPQSVDAFKYAYDNGLLNEEQKGLVQDYYSRNPSIFRPFGKSFVDKYITGTAVEEDAVAPAGDVIPTEAAETAQPVSDKLVTTKGDVRYVKTDGTGGLVEDAEVAEVEGNTVFIKDGMVGGVVDKRGFLTTDPFVLAQTASAVNAPEDVQANNWAGAIVDEMPVVEAIDAQAVKDWFAMNNLQEPTDAMVSKILKYVKETEGK